jgi:serine/threonine protein kinase
VVAWAGRGVHGAVYKAVPVDNPHASPVALKLALLPRDPRFAREVELLSCVRHPSVPRLWDHGEWQHPGGTLYPFLVMDWIDGAPLYDWARQHNPSSQEVMQLLAQLARALQAVHAQGCVHRDVKGDNVLVRHSDSRALLTDFGSGRYPDAVTLTPDILPPGTPAYCSPEASLFSLQFFRDPTARYSAQPADDLYALGVTAYRLVTGQYPEFAEPSQDEAGTWHLEGLASPAPRVLNPRVAPRLDALILRMLAIRAEARGTAAELAEALEQAAQHTSVASTRSLFEVSSRTVDPAERSSSPASPRSWRRRLAKAAALLALGGWAWWLIPSKFPEQPAGGSRAPGTALREDGGASGLGDEAANASMAASPPPSVPGVKAEDTLPEPLPGQERPDAKGRCAHQRHIPLNGGCWKAVPIDREECAALKLAGHNGHMFKGACYVPVIVHGRQPTSEPVRKP